MAKSGLIHPHPMTLEEDRRLFTQNTAPLSMGGAGYPGRHTPSSSYAPATAFPRSRHSNRFRHSPSRASAIPALPPHPSPALSSPEGNLASPPPFASQGDSALAEGNNLNIANVGAAGPQPDLGAGSRSTRPSFARDRGWLRGAEGGRTIQGLTVG
ncbi:hypothetical protein JB92DRAFT_3112181 [Gautieria morchelliformis]|nr:hypothetical protein JB92DRAFT_3112181 [Gautieria morchelliformis]